MNNTSSITGGTAATRAQYQGTTAKAMGKDDFIKMLIAQLRNQDPTNPQGGAEFAAQLAQFSSLEQLTNLNTAITSQSQNDVNLRNAQLVNLIGKNITAQTPPAADGTPAAPVSGQVTAVNYKNQAVSLTVAGQDISFSDILAVNR